MRVRVFMKRIIKKKQAAVLFDYLPLFSKANAL